MRKIPRAVFVVALVAAAASSSACADEGDGSGPAGSGPTTVEVVMLDDLRFEPSSVEVSVGETVRFAVSNDGAIVHDFSLGHDTEHEEGMGGAAAVVLEPGESGELTYTFEEVGEVDFGCHQPGHLEAGMVFTAHVS